MVADKLTMVHLLEARVPFLNEALLDFAVPVPGRHKLQNLGRTVLIDGILPGKR